MIGVPSMAPDAARTGPATRLRVDPVACDGIGLCALVAPRLITLDRWGYPVLAAGAAEAQEAAARRAVAACPRRALWLSAEPPAEQR